MKSIQNYECIILIFFLIMNFRIMNFRNLKEKRMKTIHKKNTTFLNLAAGLLVAALVLGCNTNVSNGSEVQPEKFTVIFNVNGGNGKLTATVDGKAITSPVQVEKGKNVAFTATPHKKYAVDKWSITPSNALIENGKAEDTIAKVKVTANTTVNVTFKAIKYPVTMTHGEHGDITANMPIPAEGIDYGTEITFTATANPGYQVDTWTVTPTEALIENGKAEDATAKVKVTENTIVNVTFKPIVYTSVAYANLHNHLTTAQPETNGIYYIEVTGLTAPDVKGDVPDASPLGQILNSNSQKKVALKFGAMAHVTDMKYCFKGCTSLTSVLNIPDGVTDMSWCFSGCTKLEQVPNIPDGITDMSLCFKGCTKLERVPNIPNSVTDMDSCFSGCTKLERVPNLPNSVTNMYSCFQGCTSLTSVTLKCGYHDGTFTDAFSGCSRLSVGSIKVPATSLDAYKDNAYWMGAKAEWFAKDE